tara:strand:- start:61642 stop:61914 length:273 start_codon:yes stop_codon:yes gene_type:complete
MKGLNLLNWATFSCKVATEMIEKQLVTELTYTEKIKLSVHTSMCKTCQAYGVESALIDESIKKQQHNPEQKNATLSEEFKAELIEKLASK